jgi:hypothetical protein
MILIRRSFQGFLGCELNYSAKNNEIDTLGHVYIQSFLGNLTVLYVRSGWASIKDVEARCPILEKHGRRYVA